MIWRPIQCLSVIVISCLVLLQVGRRIPYSFDGMTTLVQDTATTTTNILSKKKNETPIIISKSAVEPEERIIAPKEPAVQIKPMDGNAKKSIPHREVVAGSTEPQSRIPMNSTENSNHGSNDIRSAYDHIVFKWREQNISRIDPPIPVVVWPMMDPVNKGESADARHIEKNGIEESSFLTLAAENGIKTMDPNVVWITDVKFGYKEWCIRLHKKVLLTQERRVNASLPMQWPIFVVDFTDTTKYVRCPPIEEALGKDFIFYSKRSIIANRTWNKDAGWVNLGEKLPEISDERFYQHTPLIVRTDTIQLLSQILYKNYNLKLSDPLEEIIERKIDVAHYWPSDGSSNVGVFHCKLRNKVTSLVNNLSADWNVFTGIVGMADRVGRRFPQSAYIEAMLGTKIVVVTQRDQWEDHYRLYEALVSGAMVMTDKMLILPSGLQNGTSIVEFASADEFLRLASHYLQNQNERMIIAKKGRAIAMSKHRSWHRMEEIVLGNPLTLCGSKNGLCPYVVHANESISYE